MTSTCAAHPDRPAQALCARCGAFACEQELVRVGQGVYCGACGVRPDVAWLDQWRASVEGRPDFWAWFELLASPVNLAAALGWVVVLSRSGPGLWTVLPALEVSAAALGALFFLGRRWARNALLLAVPLTRAVLLGLVGMRAELVPGLVWAVFSLLLSLGIYADGRNRLFFRLPLSEKKLQEAWDQYANNATARAGYSLAVMTFLIPPLVALAPLTFMLCVHGLLQVDPKATPPIGRRGSAIAGMVIVLLQAGLAALLLSRGPAR